MFFFQSLKYITFQFTTSASALHTQITQHHSLVLDNCLKNRSSTHIVYCISFAKIGPFFAEILCGYIPTSTAGGIFLAALLPGWSRNRGTRIKKIMTTPIAAMMRPINRPLGLFLWCCWRAILAHVPKGSMGRFVYIIYLPTFFSSW